MSKQQINELKNLIEQLFIDSVAMKLKNQIITIGILTPKGKEALKNLSGLDFKDEIRFCLHSGDLRHIYQHHYGSNESPTSGLSPLVMEDIRCIAEILVHPDEVIYLGDDGKGKKFAFLTEKDKGLMKTRSLSDKPNAIDGSGYPLAYVRNRFGIG